MDLKSIKVCSSCLRKNSNQKGGMWMMDDDCCNNNNNLNHCSCGQSVDMPLMALFFVVFLLHARVAEPVKESSMSKSALLPWLRAKAGDLLMQEPTTPPLREESNNKLET